ncbi:aldehyde dehydrogenase family protein, partial [Pseudomonas syringae pv. tagetis]
VLNERAGVPKGLDNVIPGFGQSIGQALICKADISKVGLGGGAAGAPGGI